MATFITTSSTDTSTSTSTAFTGGGPARRGKGASGKQRKRRYDPCAICLEEYEVGDQLRELPCKHFFHSQCIDPWFKDVHGICPVCKRDYSEGKQSSLKFSTLLVFFIYLSFYVVRFLARRACFFFDSGWNLTKLFYTLPIVPTT
ncbi:hypothetical protein K457DRAFT_79102 [Linnemannia elongata AG-77]|uniref:RING-type domain-containing protein n=1 Tax=Linnemannia elongata AG-77 TaxID=1314771 RepID=A0A197JQ25_9FUNG|nr:hypothetical protein K457DRAFT_79102 [Linnemannia elongata AG-77]